MQTQLCCRFGCCFAIRLRICFQAHTFIEAVAFHRFSANRCFQLTLGLSFAQSPLAFIQPCLCALLQTGLSQQHRRAAILQHETNAFGRIICIQRHICASSLPHRQYADQHVYRAFTPNADNRFASDTFISQSTRQLICTFIQCAVRKLLLFVHHRHMIRYKLGLFFHVGMEQCSCFNRSNI
ncbi:hypothetical protein D1872_159520 [compost metagenome]